ncbi:class I SAM-dependent methyltransferase [archaeon]|nr:MAG: class I SAM-dependent methyltransferase [archaeon]
MIVTEAESAVERGWLASDISAPKKMLGHVCDLAGLGNNLESDKVNPYHNYQALYCDLFRHYRNSPVRMLEIGFGCGHNVHGSSALVWNKFFSQLKYYTVDYMDNTNAHTVQKCVKGFQISYPGIVQKVWLGDQSNVTFLQQIAKENPEKRFDIIIDDGGHEFWQIMPSLENLWPLVSYGGYYIVEDLQDNKEFAEQMAKWIYKFSMGESTARKGPVGDQKFTDVLPKHIKMLGCAFQICYFKKIEPPSHNSLPMIWGEDSTIVP